MDWDATSSCSGERRFRRERASVAGGATRAVLQRIGKTRPGSWRWGCRVTVARSATAIRRCGRDAGAWGGSALHARRTPRLWSTGVCMMQYAATWWRTPASAPWCRAAPPGAPDRARRRPADDSRQACRCARVAGGYHQACDRHRSRRLPGPRRQGHGCPVEFVDWSEMGVDAPLSRRMRWRPGTRRIRLPTEPSARESLFPCEVDPARQCRAACSHATVVLRSLAGADVPCVARCAAPLGLSSPS